MTHPPKRSPIRGLVAASTALALSVAGLLSAPVAQAANSDLGYPTFTGSANPVPDTGVTYDPHNELGAIFDADVAKGAGSDPSKDFWFDTMLARTGTTGSFGDNNQWLFSRGRAVFMKDHDPAVLGFGGQVAYWESIDNRGAYAITANVGGTPVTLTEKTAQRKQTPSYWRSVFGTSDSSLTVTETKFITDANVAVTEVELSSTAGAKNVTLTAASPYATTAEGTELTGVVSAFNNLTTIYPRFSGDGFAPTADGKLTATIAVPAGGSATTKVQLGFVTPEIAESRTDYDAYRAATPQAAYTTHVTAYNKWWADNVPYLDTPEDNIDKTLFYRWWLMRFNYLDANMPGNTFQFPTSVEGALGYNNAIVLTAGMFLDDLKYLRNPAYSYGTWVSAGETAKSAKYVDNPGDPANWSNSYTQYISEAAWRSYELHGGPTPIAENLGTYAANDVTGLIAAYDTNKDGLIDYNWAAMTGNDADAVSFDERPGASMDRTENAYLYSNALAAASAFRQAGDTANAAKMDTFAANIKAKVLDLLWDPDDKLFKHRFTSDGKLAKWKETNNYYPFTVGLVPKPGDADYTQDYTDALRLFADDAQYPIFPFFTANQADKKEAAAAGFPGSNNFSVINSTVLFRMFSSVLRNYPTDAITAESYKKLLYWNAWAHYQNGGDNRLPDQNEFWADGTADPQNIGYRSWIHHTILGATNFTMIEDTMGLRQRDDAKIELDPIDIQWDHFTANNIRYRDKDLTITWDQPGGTRYYGSAVPEGYSVFLDGKLAFTVDKLSHVVYDPATGKVTVPSGVNVLTANTDSVQAPAEVTFAATDRVVDLFAKAGANIDPASQSSDNLAAGAAVTASFSAAGRGPAGAVDGTTINEPFWGTAGSPNATDWMEVDLGAPKTIDDARVYFYQSSSSATVAGYSEPQSFTVQYLDGADWKPVPAQARSPQYPQANYNNIQFPAITAQKIRVQVTHASGAKTGVKEVQVYDTGIAAPASTNAAPFVDAYRQQGAAIPGQATLVGTVKDDGLPGAGVTSAWSVVSAPEGGQAIFENAAAASTKVRFTAAGDYVLRLTASDGELSSAKDLTVTGDVASGGVNIAPTGKPTASSTASWNNVNAVNDGDVLYSGGAQTQLWGTWSGTRPATQWLQYDWTSPVRVDKASVAFWYDTPSTTAGDGVAVPKSWKVQYWDGSAWVDVPNPDAYPVKRDATNTVNFDPVTTTKLRATFTAATNGSTNAAIGVSEWEVYAEAPVSIDPIDARTSVGTLPALPATVQAVYADGSRQALPVSWSPVTADQVAAEGSFPVAGIVDGSPLPATATVWVRATPPGQITTVSPVAVSTRAGVKPVLPSTVTVQYNDGSKQSGIAVSWAAVDASQYATAGTFTVAGTVAGSPQDAVATVTVTAAPTEDKTKPTVSLATDPAAPGSGWYTGNVSVTVSAQDDTDPSPTVEANVDAAGWKPYTAAIAVSGDGSHTVQARATDAAGNVSIVASATLKIDTAAPVVTPVANASERTVKATASDTGSGVKSVEYRVGDTGAWQPYTRTVVVGLDATSVFLRSTDVAGNVSAESRVDVPKDDGTAHRNVALLATPSASYTAAWNAVGGLNDDVAPTTSGDVTPSDNANVWGAWPQVSAQWTEYDWSTPVTVGEVRAYFVSNLDGNGVGIDLPKAWALQYWDDQASAWADVTGASAYGTKADQFNSVTFAPVTTTKLRMNLTPVGTTETIGSVGVKEWQVWEATAEVPDTQAPVVTTGTSPATPASGWHTGDVTVTASALDDHDGAPALEYRVGDGAWAAYTAPVVVKTDGASTVSFRATDAAGNRSEPVSVEVKRDSAGPEVSASADATARTATIAATDVASGVAAIEYRIDGGVWTPYTAALAFGADKVTIEYRATDVAGNVSAVGKTEVGAASTTPPTTPPTDGPGSGSGTVTGKEVVHLGSTRVAPGGQLAVTVTGGAAGAVFQVELHSDPIVLGTLTIGQDGTGTALFTIPASVPSGTHEVWVTLNGTTYRATLIVAAPGATVDEALASTGSTAVPVAPGALGAAAILLGALALAATVIIRRRRLGAGRPE
ncbi:OmpL47-type beta-barrel domain-containing protein [Leifsonia aquatica]|uniref:F5/8 type C domain-containing protein n=1 Tax=Leifsonia aquatica TaxID=144185 RepID=A0A7W4UZ52_LEIAQ|nr:Ig-like domain-containing protein [Leifsonia aquatica]MBB2968954.1 hypothetical protein [Leifsonia aquatica]